MKTDIILQARMNSSRLPGKIAMRLKGRTVLEHVIDRLKMFDRADDIIVATTSTEADDLTCAIAGNAGVKVFRGSEDNVLERYYLCAKEYNADQVIRATADDPLTSIELLNAMYDSHMEKTADYTYSDGYPIGVQEEIVSFEALERCHALSYKQNHFEHVLEYILENESDFRVNLLSAPIELNRPDVRITLDTIDDFRIIEKYYNSFDNIKTITIHDIIEYWERLK